MKQYIGTKLIEAEKAYRVDGKVVTLAENKVPCGYKVERGYKVRYADGYLSKSLELLATADVAIFAEDWWEARGCRIERECADGYGVARIKFPEEG